MQPNQHTAFLQELKATAEKLDSLLQAVGYELVSEELGMSSSAVPELMIRCAEAIAAVAPATPQA